jgi:hypothetical protein
MVIRVRRLAAQLRGTWEWLLTLIVVYVAVRDVSGSQVVALAAAAVALTYIALGGLIARRHRPFEDEHGQISRRHRLILVALAAVPPLALALYLVALGKWAYAVGAGVVLSVRSVLHWIAGATGHAELPLEERRPAQQLNRPLRPS